MLSNLKKVQDQLYSNQSIAVFLKSHTVFDLITLLNKANKNQTKVRIQRFFYKLTETDHYETFLHAGLTTHKDNKKQFGKYISSENSQEYFELLQKRGVQLIKMMESNPQNIPLIFSLVYYDGGIKMIKFFTKLYAQFGHIQVLFSDIIHEEFERGLQAEDSVIKMRFVEIVANIAIKGGKHYHFISELLEKSLEIYTTEDILLKLNIAQIVSCLGASIQTAQMLKEHKVWSYIEKDALNPAQQFYVRKSLLVLLVEMANNGFYEYSHKFTKNTISFLQQCLMKKGEYLEGAVSLIQSLFRSNEGIKLVVQNQQVFNLFIVLSLTTQDQIKNLFIAALTSLADKNNGIKMKALVINVFSSIGNPNLSGQFCHNINSNHFTMAGIQQFCSWLTNLLSLPFEDLQLKLIQFLISLLEYGQVCQVLFEDQKLTKFLLKPVSATAKTLISYKNRLVGTIIEKGQKEWKGSKLQAYAQMIEKELQRQKMQLEYDMMAEN